CPDPARPRQRHSPCLLAPLEGCHARAVYHPACLDARGAAGRRHVRPQGESRLLPAPSTAVDVPGLLRSQARQDRAGTASATPAHGEIQRRGLRSPDAVRSPEAPLESPSHLREATVWSDSLLRQVRPQGESRLLPAPSTAVDVPGLLRSQARQDRAGTASATPAHGEIQRRGLRSPDAVRSPEAPLESPSHLREATVWSDSLFR